MANKTYDDDLLLDIDKILTPNNNEKDNMGFFKGLWSSLKGLFSKEKEEEPKIDAIATPDIAEPEPVDAWQQLYDGIEKEQQPLIWKAKRDPLVKRIWNYLNPLDLFKYDKPYYEPTDEMKAMSNTQLFAGLKDTVISDMNSFMKYEQELRNRKISPMQYMETGAAVAAFSILGAYGIQGLMTMVGSNPTLRKGAVGFLNALYKVGGLRGIEATKAGFIPMYAGYPLDKSIIAPIAGIETVGELQLALQQIIPQYPAIIEKLIDSSMKGMITSHEILSATQEIPEKEVKQQFSAVNALRKLFGVKAEVIPEEEKIALEQMRPKKEEPLTEKDLDTIIEGIEPEVKPTIVPEIAPKAELPPAEPPTIPPKVPPSDVPKIPGEPEPEIDPIDKLNELLKAAKPLRGEIERAYTEERGKRIIEVDKFIKDKIDTVGGKEGYEAIIGKLKGELIDPEAKPRFEPVEDKLTEEELKSLYLKTWKHPYLTTFEKVTSGKGLTDLFMGNIPPPSTLVLMEEVYGSELIKNLLSKRLWGAKVTDFAVEAANIPRALLATADMSAFLRQGVIEIPAHPVISAKAMAKTFEFAFKPETFEQYYSKDLREHKHYVLMRKSGVAITDPRKPIGEREEPFISRILQKIPFLKIPVEFAERAYTGFLTKLRVDIFSLWADELLGQDKSPIKDKKLFDAAADVVNTFTGRGSLGKAGNRIAPQLNAVFFSPRLIAARFNSMNPVWYAKQPPEIRKKALGDFAKFIIAGTTTLALIKLASMDNDEINVETDPRSADFGKVRVGNTRFDIWGGHQQFARAFTQIIMGERKSSTTGEIMSLNKDEYPFSTRQDVLYKFIEGKLAPGPALIRELMAGAKTFEGEDITIQSVATQKLIPMYIQDIVEAYRDGGLGIAVPAGTLAFFGIGVQTYGKKKPTEPTVDFQDLFKDIF